MDTRTSDNAVQHYRYTVEEAEERGGIKQWQVSRWGTRLEEPEKYRAMLYGAAYAKAMAQKNRVLMPRSGVSSKIKHAQYI